VGLNYYIGEKRLETITSIKKRPFFMVCVFNAYLIY